MKHTIYGFLFLALVASVATAGMTQAASARCEVVEKRGSVLVMDCGDRADGFERKSRVKIKSDRDQHERREG